MTAGIRTITIPVKYLDATRALYRTLLGVEPYADQPYYVGFRPEGAPEIGLDPNGHAKGMTGPVGYWHVDDINKTIAALIEAGGSAQQPATDVGGGKLVATVADADGNVIGVIQDPPSPG